MHFICIFFLYLKKSFFSVSILPSVISELKIIITYIIASLEL